MPHLIGLQLSILNRGKNMEDNFGHPYPKWIPISFDPLSGVPCSGVHYEPPPAFPLNSRAKRRMKKNMKKNGATLLHIAAANNDIAYITEYENTSPVLNLKSVANLPEMPFDLLTTDDWGRTPLHYAAEAGHQDAVRRLACHANINMRDKDGHRPYDLAKAMMRVSIMRILLDVHTSEFTTVVFNDMINDLCNDYCAAVAQEVMNIEDVSPDPLPKRKSLGWCARALLPGSWIKNISIDTSLQEEVKRFRLSMEHGWDGVQPKATGGASGADGGGRALSALLCHSLDSPAGGASVVAALKPKYLAVPITPVEQIYLTDETLHLLISVEDVPKLHSAGFSLKRLKDGRWTATERAKIFEYGILNDPERIIDFNNCYPVCVAAAANAAVEEGAATNAMLDTFDVTGNDVIHRLMELRLSQLHDWQRQPSAANAAMSMSRQLAEVRLAQHQNWQSRTSAASSVDDPVETVIQDAVANADEAVVETMGEAIVETAESMATEAEVVVEEAVASPAARVDLREHVSHMQRIPCSTCGGTARALFELCRHDSCFACYQTRVEDGETNCPTCARPSHDVYRVDGPRQYVAHPNEKCAICFQLVSSSYVRTHCEQQARYCFECRRKSDKCPACREETCNYDLCGVPASTTSTADSSSNDHNPESEDLFDSFDLRLSQAQRLRDDPSNADTSLRHRAERLIADSLETRSYGTNVIPPGYVEILPPSPVTSAFVHSLNGKWLFCYWRGFGWAIGEIVQAGPGMQIHCEWMCDQSKSTHTLGATRGLHERQRGLHRKWVLLGPAP